MLKIKGDAKLSETDKKAKLADLQKQYDDIAMLVQKAPSM